MFAVCHNIFSFGVHAVDCSKSSSIVECGHCRSNRTWLLSISQCVPVIGCRLLFVNFRNYEQAARDHKGF